MNWILLPLTLLATLAGCMGGAVDSDQKHVEQAPPQEARMPYLGGSYAWHFDPAAPMLDRVVLGSMGAAIQAAAHPCLFDEQPYFTNLHLTPDGPPGPVVNGTTDLAVLLDWEDDDYRGQELWLAFRPNGTRQYNVVGPVPRGEERFVPVEPAWWGTGRHPTITWDLWLCLAREGTNPTEPGYEPRLYVGSVDVAIDLIVV